MTRQVLFIILMLAAEVIIGIVGVCTNNQFLIRTVGVLVSIMMTVGWISSFNQSWEIWWNKKIKFKK